MIAWVIGLIGMSYSLYLSQYLGQEPCLFCWWERMCLFPLTLLPIIPLYRGDYSIFPYLLILSVIGALVAAWQTILFSMSSLCSLSGGCEIHGAAFALVGFILITIFLALGSKREV